MPLLRKKRQSRPESNADFLQSWPESNADFWEHARMDGACAGIAAVVCALGAIFSPAEMLDFWRIGFVASLASKVNKTKQIKR